MAYSQRQSMDANVLDNLKANGWRWSRFAGCWYKTASEAAIDFACSVAGVSAEDRAKLVGSQPAGPDRFDMAVEDQMCAACGA